MLGGHLSVGRGRDVLLDLDDVKIERWPLHHQFATRALDLRSAFTASDASYVVLAESIDAPLVTLVTGGRPAGCLTYDERLAEVTRLLGFSAPAPDAP